MRTNGRKKGNNEQSTIVKKEGESVGFTTSIDIMLELMRLIRNSTEDAPIKCKELSLLLGYSPTSTHAQVRKVILECMEYDAKFVPVASNRGYYLARSERQVEDYISNLSGRISKIQERIEKVKSNFHTRRRNN